LRQQAVDVCAREHFLGLLGGKAIQALVQIHDKAVQGVAAPVGSRGQLANLSAVERIR
jgi:hypothetical protein